MSTIRVQGKEGTPIVVDLEPTSGSPVYVRIAPPDWIDGTGEGVVTVRVVPVFLPYKTALAVIEGLGDPVLYVTPSGELLFVQRPDMEPQELITVIRGETVRLRRLDVSTLVEYNKTGKLAPENE